MSLAERIAQGEVILMDGATGTELERRGVPMNHDAWSAGAVQTHPTVVRQVHEEYIRAGAEIIITNTFSTSRHVLESAGLADQFEELNAQAVLLARQARQNVAQHPVWIAGSISTTTFSRRQPSAKRAKANFAQQAEILAEAGVDLIILEMMRDIEYTGIALRAALATGLPVWVGFSCVVREDGQILLFSQKETLAEGVAAIAPLGAAAFSVMHTQTEDMINCLAEVKKGWTGPLAAYSHSGQFVMPNWQFTDVISPADYAVQALKWVEMGVQVVGGCCGIGPEHIQFLKERLPKRLSDDSGGPPGVKEGPNA